ncbi:MAG: porin [Saprospiraceae bacterium]|nr:porin [Saprospiraceae bacterium]
MKKILILALFIINIKANAQVSDSTKSLIFSGYIETYYGGDFNKSPSHERPSFMYNHNRSHEFNINLVYLKAAYSSSAIRANLSLMTGTYANANLVAEQGVLKNIYEANIGIKLSKTTWLDVGVLPSHIGFESAISKDCWSLTRSILAENSPYYESGARLTYAPNDKWTLVGLVLNGWQRIRRVDGNNTPAFGTQIVFKPNGKTTLNYSTFVGSDKPDSARQMRIFHNLYGIFQVSEKFGLTLGFDIGTEQKNKNSSEVNVWYAPILIGKYTINDKWAIAGRIENYTDKQGVIISNDFLINGFSANLDFTPVSNAVFRIETRLLKAKNKIFTTKNGISNQSTFVTSSLAVSF